jgi:hypothetical protein
MSEVRVNKLSPRSGTTVTLGDSGDTITIPSGVTLSTASFSSTGIDDNATSTAITIDSSQRVGIGSTAPSTDASANADSLVIKKASGNVGMSIITDGSSNANIFLGDTSDSLNALIQFNDSANELRVGTSNGGGDLVLNSGAGVEALRIDDTGNVGIGTSSPTARFDTRISTLTGKVAEFHNSGGYGIDLTVESNSGVNTISSGTTQGLAFATNSSSNERMRIDSSGRVLVGTTNTTPIGFGQNAMTYDNGRLAVQKYQSDSLRIGRYGDGYNQNSGQTVIFYNGGIEVGSISVFSSSTAYNTSSDYRLKENVSYDFDATTRLKQLKPARFNFIEEPNKTVDGFLAHEVSSVVPEAISGTKDAVQVWEEGEELPEGVSVGDNKLDENGNTIIKPQGIDQSKLVPLLVKTIQELEARITTLENA